MNIPLRSFFGAVPMPASAEMKPLRTRAVGEKPTVALIGCGCQMMGVMMTPQHAHQGKARAACRPARGAYHRALSQVHERS